MKWKLVEKARKMDRISDVSVSVILRLLKLVDVGAIVHDAGERTKSHIRWRSTSFPLAASILYSIELKVACGFNFCALFSLALRPAALSDSRHNCVQTTWHYNIKCKLNHFSLDMRFCHFSVQPGLFHSARGNSRSSSWPLTMRSLNFTIERKIYNARLWMRSHYRYI